MDIKAVFFDLDGTLLPMDQDEFVHKYLGSLAAKLAPYGYEPKTFVKTIFDGITAMSNGKKLNEEDFWDNFVAVYGEGCKEHIPVFEDYYLNDFDNVSSIVNRNEKANEIVKNLKANGVMVILATNPVFPAIATECRMKWAGLDKNDFDLVTTYENSYTTKPSLAYYEEILDKFGLKPNECIMVGNDVGDDMVAENLGFKVFLLTDYLINTENKDISKYPQGGFLSLEKFLNENI